MAITRSGNPKWRIHPGEILREEYLKPLNLKPAQLARAIRVSAPTVNELVRERRTLTADIAVRLARFFNTTEQFWLGLQASYDVNKVKAAMGKRLQKIKPRTRVRAA